MSKQLDLNIDQITLEGFSNIDQKSLAQSIESELTHLLKSQDLPSSFSAALSTRKLDFGHFDLPSNAGPKLIGRHIAKSIYSGFVKQGTMSSSAKRTEAVLSPDVKRAVLPDVKRAGALTAERQVPFTQAKS